MIRNSWVTASIFLSMAVIVASAILGVSLYQSRQSQNVVTVKGLSEREVTADRGWWSIQANYGANSVEQIQRGIEDHQEKIVRFLEENGFSKEEIKVETINIFQNNYEQATVALNADIRISVTSSKVLQIAETSEKVGELIKEGILISSDKWASGPKYYFTNFSELKTEMLAEATKEAKKAAEQFAANSDTRVGKIRKANQGIFQILPGNRTNENEEFYIDKIVRVVSTIDYYLR